MPTTAPPGWWLAKPTLLSQQGLWAPQLDFFPFPLFFLSPPPTFLKYLLLIFDAVCKQRSESSSPRPTNPISELGLISMVRSGASDLRLRADLYREFESERGLAEGSCLCACVSKGSCWLKALFCPSVF